MKASTISRATSSVNCSGGDFNTQALIAAEGYLENTGGNFEEAAVLFLRNQEAVWTQWLTHDPRVVQKVRDALNNR